MKQRLCSRICTF